VNKTVRIMVDGTTHRADVDPQMPLLYFLRDEVGLTNPRFGCGLAQCGACTVLVDGTEQRSCVLPVATAQGHAITTLAGLGTPEHPHPIQAAFAEEEAMQCGYCVNGWMMTGAALLHRNPSPSDREIRDALDNLVCRCGSQIAMLRAVKRAAGGHA